MASRSDSIPSISVKGSHYEVGFQVGLNFKDMIHSYMEAAAKLYQLIFNFYETDDGKRMYNESLMLLKEVFPDYIKEIKGIAEGSGIAFYKLFLLHLDAAYAGNEAELKKHAKIGCSSILCNFPGQRLIGHNEDALPNALNHCYVVDAEITETDAKGVCVTKEKFTALCYAGELPGFCMGCNHHRLAYSINIIQADVHSGRIPRHFLCRALLNAKDLDQVLNILRAQGYGVTDGISVNLGIQTGSGLSVFNIEVAPHPTKQTESALDVYEVKHSESYLHCNSFKRLDVPSPDGCKVSSQHREATYKDLPLPTDEALTLNVLGNRSDPDYSFFREGNEPHQVVTIATGIFNFDKGVWTLYSKNPKTAKPIAAYPL